MSFSHMEAPAWSRLLYRASRGLTAVDRAQQILRDELFLALLTPPQRTALTLDAYAKTNRYGPGGEAFSAGLFAWELKLLDDPRVPRAGRVLLTAAGGGRELQGLEQRGYDVSAFEPVERLLASARSVSQRKDTLILHGTYQDLADLADGRGGPLERLRGEFDLCVLGWGSLSHLTEPSAVVEVLRAVRMLAPRAPVMASFFLRASTPAPTAGGARKLRRFVRRALIALGGRAAPPGLEFLTEGGFMYAFSSDELASLCEQAGYELGYLSDSDYPHALLLPKA